MAIMDDKRPADLPDRRPLWVQFKEWRERDWFILGYPPARPSPYWFSLATDAVWMVLSVMEKGLVLQERIAYALENPTKPKDPVPIPGPHVEGEEGV